MPPKKTTPPSSVKTYASRPGYTELRYRIGSTLKREFVADAKAPARREQIEADLLKFRAPLTDREVEEYRAAVYLLPTGTTLIQAVTEFAKTTPTQHLDWSAAIEAFEEHECGRVDQRTLRDRKAQLTDLTLATGTTSPSHLTSAVLRTHLATFTSPQTANHRRSTYAMFMDWYLDHTGDTRPNPVRAVKSRKIAPSDPVPFSYVDRDRLIETAIAEKNATALFVLVLGSFCGIRSCEIERLIFGDVFKNDEVLRTEISLGSAITKTNRRRVVPIHPAARPLLWQAFEFSPRFRRGFEQPLLNQTPHNQLKKIAAKAGVQWVDNGLRKGFVSAATTLYGAPTAARWAGHSEAVLESEYRALVSRTDALAWFKGKPFTEILLPETR